jgi:hypothetical protein
MGSSSGSTTTTPPSSNHQPQNGTLNVIVSDDPTQEWATIGIKVLSISLTPQSGGNPVTVFTSGTPAPTINLLQLDQLDEILQSATIPAGTYSSATITLSGNPGDVTLIASADPEAGFAPLTTIPRPDSHPWNIRKRGQLNRRGEFEAGPRARGGGRSNAHA